MSNIIKTALNVTFVRETPPQVIKLMDVASSEITNTFDSGELDIKSGDTSVVLASSVNKFYLVSDKEVTLSIDGTSFGNVTSFMYGSSTKKTFSITTTSTTAAHVCYASSVYLTE